MASRQGVKVTVRLKRDMRKEISWFAIIYVLLSAAPARATIQAVLETPSNGQQVSGKQLVSGWGYSTLPDTAVTVELLINGDLTGIIIPCCGPRADVSATPSGFGLLLNYGNFDPATLQSIGVKITAPGAPSEAPVTLISNVQLVKPGARSSDSPPTLFSFLEQLTPAGGRGVIDGDEVILAPVSVIDSGTGEARLATVRLLWTSNTQSFGIVAAASGTSFAGVQEIFNNSCATTQCHDRTTVAGGLDLSEGRAYRRTVGVRGEQDPKDRFRVNPGKVSDSYLYQKIIAGGDIAEARMPPGCSGNPNACLSAQQIQLIENWINEGAPPPQKEE